MKTTFSNTFDIAGKYTASSAAYTTCILFAGYYGVIGFTDALAAELGSYHIVSKTKRPPPAWRPFQMYFPEWKYENFD